MLRRRTHSIRLLLAGAGASLFGLTGCQGDHLAARSADARAKPDAVDAAPLPDAAPRLDAAFHPDAAMPPDAAPARDAAQARPDARLPVDATPALPDAAPPDAAIPDAAPAPPDATPPDAAPAPAPPDAAIPDAAAPDAALPDAAIPDAFALGGPLFPRVDNLTCRLPALPPLGSMAAEEVFPSLDFTNPVFLGHAGDGSNRLYVVERTGSVWVFENRPDVADKTEFLHVPAFGDGEMGLLGLAFHPNFAVNGLLYVDYTLDAPRRSRLSEFHRSAADPNVADPASERVLLEVPQPFLNHKGGDLAFGPDGYLYWGLGDGGSAGDPRGHGQSVVELLGSMLRLDVDHPAPDLAYGIPPDNPFAGCTPNCGAFGAARPEVWAWGLRNPWRWSFDPPTGNLWIGDVGQNLWEEIDRVAPGDGGGNFGWNVWEGNHCFNADNCVADGYRFPIHEYPHTDGLAVIGGYVYRGGALPELWGAYVFGDAHNGRIWALREQNGVETETALLVDSPISLTSFGIDQNSELYALGYNAGRSIWHLVRRADRPAPVEFPQRLSQTGCFTDVATLTYAPGVVPYDVNSPLWSDGAVKDRALALPPGEALVARDDRSWDTPVGTVAIKTFSFPQADGSLRRVETRLLARQGTEWQGFSYRWNDTQDDAELLPGAYAEDVDTRSGPLTWTYPSRAQCETCHTEPAGHFLGLTTAQLNGDFDYPGGRANQLAAMAGADYVSSPGPPANLPRLARPTDDDAPVEDRVRGILAANCSHCHRPGVVANTHLDLRAEVSLHDTGLCDAPPTQGDLGLANAQLLAPGDPNRSVLLARMEARGPEQMPPLATRRVDLLGVELVRRFISELGVCPNGP